MTTWPPPPPSPGPPAPGPWVERWLSQPRHGVYLAASQGDQQLALDLYEWNAEISAARVMGHEVSPGPRPKYRVPAGRPP